jgi:hypothetical protein
VSGACSAEPFVVVEGWNKLCWLGSTALQLARSFPVALCLSGVWSRGGGCWRAAVCGAHHIPHLHLMGGGDKPCWLGLNATLLAVSIT